MIRRAIQLRDNVADYHYNLARALKSQGRSEEAQAELSLFEKLSDQSLQSKTIPDNCRALAR